MANPGKGVRIRGVYGKPLSKAAGFSMAFSSKQLRRAGEIILKAIKDEIKKDIAKVAGIKGAGDPVTLPKTDRFVQSWSVQLKGKSTIEITSSWPTATAHTTDANNTNMVENTREGETGDFAMTWLTRPKVPFARIVTSGGKVIVRSTPLPSGKLWRHPGFKKYTFIERGLRKGRAKVAEEFALELIRQALAQHDILG